MHVQNKPKCIEVLACRMRITFMCLHMLYMHIHQIYWVYRNLVIVLAYIGMKRPAFHSSDHALLRYTNKVYLWGKLKVDLFGVHFKHNSTQTAHFE